MRGAAHLFGALIAAVLAGALYGETLEEEFFPVLSNTVVSNVIRAGSVVNWHQEWCKYRNLEIVSTSYSFTYPKQNTGVQINVQNLTIGQPVGAVTFSAGCYGADYAAVLPKDANGGGTIKAQLWYNPGHPFWDVRADFAEVTIPALPPSTGQGIVPRPE